MAPQLRYLTSWKRIYVTPDLTKKERDEGKRLREELSNRRQAGEENLAIGRGKIVKLPQMSRDDTNSSSRFASQHSTPCCSHQFQQVVTELPPTIRARASSHPHGRTGHNCFC